ncbi:MAG: alpha-mannosidase, partial [Opitutaceae bacterium]|nr:alpha-mannosidase [Opitutaceae bacterium]
MDKDGSRFDGAFLAYRNDDAWHAYYDLEILIDLLKLEIKRFNGSRDFGEIDRGKHADLERFSPEGRLLIRGLNEAYTLFYQAGLTPLRKHLQSLYQRLSANPMSMQMRLIGHAHIDLVWMWEERVGEFKAVHTFSTVSTLMREYPELTFCYSQPASYEAVARRSPPLIANIQEHINSGQWEPLGATEVECDTQIPCGEALIRCFEVGQEGFRQLTGKNNPILWIPDVFGYTACLPQIMKSCDVDYFYTTKLLWNDSTDFPHSSFIWKGQDGTEVIAHISLKSGYNRLVKPEQLLDTALAHQQSDIHPEALEPTGYGDGGGGPTAEMCERARRVKKIFGMPATYWGRVDGFFENLAKTSDQLPVYKGELYLEFHRGVLTTIGSLKFAYRMAERALQTWEAVRSCRGEGAIDKAAWKRLLFTQFHDYLPGTSIKEVYDQGIPELQEIATSAFTSAQSEIQTGTEASLFNPLPLPLRLTYQGENESYPIELPPLTGGEPQDFKRDTGESVSCKETSLENTHLQVTFDNNGFIKTMTVEGQRIDLTGPAGELRVFEDNPAHFPAWEIDRASLSSGSCFPGEAEVEINNEDSSVCSISYRRKLTNESSVEIVYTLRSHSSSLEIDYFIDWQDPNKLLKVLFPTDYTGQNARYGNPFGSILRSQQPGELHNEAKFEVSGSRYAMVFDETEDKGLYIVTESKYGFGSASGLLHLSLLRGAMITESEVS